MSKKIDLLFMMGPTNVGKSYTINYAVEKYDGYKISVGQLLRDKYGPDFFKGQQAPEHTRAEALKMMIEGIQAGIDEGRSLILIDGQPREPGQIDAIFENYIEGPMKVLVDVHFCLLHCDDDLRMDRLKKRDKDPAALELSTKRFNRDLAELQKIFYMILVRGAGNKVVPMDMLNSEESFDDFYRMLTYDHYKHNTEDFND